MNRKTKKSMISSTEAPQTEKYRSDIFLALRAAAKDKVALAGVIILVFAIVISIFAPLVSPHDPLVMDSVAGRLAPPFSPGHILGTDSQGRDTLSRLIWAGRVSIPIALVPIIVGSVIGLILGLLSGYFYGISRELILRGMDIVLAFPGVLLAVVISSIMGAGMLNMMIAMSIVLIPYFTRLVYVEVVNTSQKEFIKAARVSGSMTKSILVHEILPNVLSPVIVYGTTSLGGMIVFAAGLSFLGVGTQPPTPDWGIMASDGRVVLAIAPWVSFIPGVVIVILAIACNLAGDAIRDALDPRQRTRR